MKIPNKNCSVKNISGRNTKDFFFFNSYKFDFNRPFTSSLDAVSFALPSLKKRLKSS